MCLFPEKLRPTPIRSARALPCGAESGGLYRRVHPDRRRDLVAAPLSFFAQMSPRRYRSRRLADRTEPVTQRTRTPAGSLGNGAALPRRSGRRLRASFNAAREAECILQVSPECPLGEQLFEPPVLGFQFRAAGWPHRSLYCRTSHAI